MSRSPAGAHERTLAGEEDARVAGLLGSLALCLGIALVHFTSAAIAKSQRKKAAGDGNGCSSLCFLFLSAALQGFPALAWIRQTVIE